MLVGSAAEFLHGHMYS